MSDADPVADRSEISNRETVAPVGAAQRGDPIRRGSPIGRYIVVDELGHGAMGVVYSAYDPELDRRIAVKLVLPGEGGSLGRARIAREAQALAKLAHPNVVAIHDVGTQGESVWLAMELVDGATLRAWSERDSPSWRERLPILVAAGRGLAAAHGVGLLHRDFKPDNVMVSADGRVRVMDFGLARPTSAAELRDAVALPTTESSQPGRSSQELTRAGDLIGTPAYMAPEQLSGLEVTAAADQFAFCVTAWELLHGQRPFGGSSLAELAASVLAGRVRPPPVGSRVPRWLVKVLERGLAVEPQQRHGSMAELLAAIERGEARSRRRVAWAGVVGVAIAITSGVAWHRAEQGRAAAACDQAGARVDAVWNPSVRREIGDAFSRTGVPFAAASLERALPWLDAHAERWRAAGIEVCHAERDGSWSPDLIERAGACLDDRIEELAALVDELGRADAAVVARSIVAAASLPAIETCRDRARLERGPAAPVERRDEIAEVRRELSRLAALEHFGGAADRVAPARAALARADAIGWAPLQADAGYRLGQALETRGEYVEATAVLEHAYFAAATDGADEQAAAIAASLVYVEGDARARFEQARLWRRIATVGLLRAGLQDDLQFGNLLTNATPGLLSEGAYAEAREAAEQALAIAERSLGPEHPDLATHLTSLALVEQADAHYPEALALLERALAVAQTAVGPDHPEVGTCIENMASVYALSGDQARALELYLRALEILERAWGERHPEVAKVLNDLGNVELAMGANDRAVATYERSLSILEEHYGADHPDVAAALMNLANARRESGDYAESRALYERALGAYERVLGPDHAEVAGCLNNLGTVVESMGELAAAGALYERARGLYQRTAGPQHPSTALSIHNLAGIALATGDRDAARALYGEALALLEAALGPDHPLIAHPLVGLADTATADGRFADAIGHAERAIALRERADAPPAELAAARFALARALGDGGSDRARARTLAEQARTELAAAGRGQARELARVEAWLSELRPR